MKSRLYEPLKDLPHRFRYINGKISKGGFNTFEEAVKCYFDSKENYGTLYSDLKDVVCVEREKDYI